jgi:hypothetical protein
MYGHIRCICTVLANPKYAPQGGSLTRQSRSCPPPQHMPCCWAGQAHLFVGLCHAAKPTPTSPSLTGTVPGAELLFPCLLPSALCVYWTFKLCLLITSLLCVCECVCAYWASELCLHSLRHSDANVVAYTVSPTRRCNSYQ